MSVTLLQAVRVLSDHAKEHHLDLGLFPLRNVSRRVAQDTNGTASTNVKLHIIDFACPDCWGMGYSKEWGYPDGCPTCGEVR